MQGPTEPDASPAVPSPGLYAPVLVALSPYLLPPTRPILLLSIPPPSLRIPPSRSPTARRTTQHADPPPSAQIPIQQSGIHSPEEVSAQHPLFSTHSQRLTALPRFVSQPFTTSSHGPSTRRHTALHHVPRPIDQVLFLFRYHSPRLIHHHSPRLAAPSPRIHGRLTTDPILITELHWSIRNSQSQL